MERERELRQLAASSARLVEGPVPEEDVPGGVDAREQPVDAAQLVAVPALDQRPIVLPARAAEQGAREGGAPALAPLGAVAAQLGRAGCLHQPDGGAAEGDEEGMEDPDLPGEGHEDITHAASGMVISELRCNTSRMRGNIAFAASRTWHS